MSDMRKLGEIALIQVHGDLLKHRDRFDPGPLVEVEEASLSADGMLGWSGSSWVVDVHHAAWPEPGPRRPLSMGFTSHYDKMRARFGTAPLGVAGENIIVACDEVVALEDLGDGVVIRCQDGREVALVRPEVARPCLPFTSFMLGLPTVGLSEEIVGHLQFLDGGTRGFILGVDELGEPVRVRVGDEVFVA